MGINKRVLWNIFIEQIITKLSSTCYAVRFMYHSSIADLCKMIHFAYFHFIMNYGIECWGNSINSKRISQLGKRIVRIMTQARFKSSCKPVFKALETYIMFNDFSGK